MAREAEKDGQEHDAEDLEALLDENQSGEVFRNRVHQEGTAERGDGGSKQDPLNIPADKPGVITERRQQQHMGNKDKRLRDPAVAIAS